MVRPDKKWELRTLQLMPPFPQCQVDGEKLPVPHVITPLGRSEPAREESTGMELTVGRSALRQDPSHSGVRSVHLHHELELAVRLREDGG